MYKGCFPKNIQTQFNLRSQEFDISAGWISDGALIKAHLDLAGRPTGKALDLCCGTGQIGRALKGQGWNVVGLDISAEMVKASSEFFPVYKAEASQMPFEDKTFSLIACRQAFQFLDAKKVFSEVARVLAPGGSFVLSLTVPFSAEDEEWLRRIHSVKQPLLLKFYTADSLKDEIIKNGFILKDEITLSVRESINRWMDHAPELSMDTKEKVIGMVKDAPQRYKQLHRVEIVNGEVFEEWNWVVFKTVFRG